MALGLVVLAVSSPFIVYYLLSYNSVNGTVVELASARRIYSPGISSSISFYLEIHVWSWGASLPTRLYRPQFTLGVDTFNLGVSYGQDGTFKPNDYVAYFLEFRTSDSTVATMIGESRASYLTMSMDAMVSAGAYSEQVDKLDAKAWVWK